MKQKHKQSPSQLHPAIHIIEDADHVVLTHQGKELMPYEQMNNPYAIGVKYSITSLISIDLDKKKFQCNYLSLVKYELQPAGDHDLSSDIVEFEGKNYRKIDLRLSNLMKEEKQMDNVRVYAIEDSDQSKEGENDGDALPRRRVMYERQSGCSGEFRFSNSRNIADFPLDVYDLMITVLVLPTNPNADKYYFGLITTGLIGEFAPILNVEPVTDEWSVFEASCVHFRTELNRVCFQMGFRVQRKSAFYIWNGFAVVFTLVLMCFTIFGVDADEVANRLVVIVTVALTIVALKLAFQSKMPACPKPNFLDCYFNSAICYCLGFTVAIAVLGKTSRNGAESDLYFSVLAVAVWVIINTIFVMHILQKYYSRNCSGKKLVSEDVAFDVRWRGQ
jgi:hypothetical protein